MCKRNPINTTSAAVYSLTGGVSRAMMMPMMTRPATGPV